VAVVDCTWFCDFAASFVDNLAAMFHRKWCWSIIIGEIFFDPDMWSRQ
jgi:hypothetical protein